MRPRSVCPVALISLCGIALIAVFAVPPAAAQEGSAPFASRVITYNPRDVVPLRTHVRFTTVIVLPVGEQILEATCGDKELWLVNATQHLAYVKPAKPGSQTNLNLLTASGAIYSFVLTEISAQAGVHADIKVYLEPASEPADDTAPRRPLFVSSQQVEDFRAQADLAREEARRAREQAKVSDEAAQRAATDAQGHIDRAVSAYKATYPTTLQFTYDFARNRRPFFVTTIFHDGTCTYIRAAGAELPALYEMTDTGASLVTFEFRNGTYVVPKVVDYGYLAIGKARLFFRRTR